MNNEKLPAAPDWATAPEWANFHAIDSDGLGCWFEKYPIKEFSGWKLTRRWTRSANFSPSNWQNSLQKRPENG